MISVEQVHQQAKDMIKSGDPNRTIIMMTTPFKLACLALHLAIYDESVKDVGINVTMIGELNEIQDDLQRVILQILQQEFPQS